MIVLSILCAASTDISFYEIYKKLTMKNSILGILVFCAISIGIYNTNIEKKVNEITSKNDYIKYLDSEIGQEKNIVLYEQNILFWRERLESNSQDNFYKQELAASLTSRFKSEGNIEDVIQSDVLLKEVLNNISSGKCSVYQALSINANSQHKFKEALYYAEKALETKEDRLNSYLVLFDALVGLNQLDKARIVLRNYPQKHTLQYVIRSAKLMDLDGDLHKAIHTMEIASRKLEAISQRESYLLAKSNLAAMYGDAGKLEEAYRCYLEVLELNPENVNALKGIAWIAYSKDGKMSEAREIVDYIQRKYKSPDACLLLAEFAN